MLVVRQMATQDVTC